MEIFVQVARLLQSYKENFQHVHLPCFFGLGLEASRELGDSLGSDTRTIDVRFHDGSVGKIH